LQFGIKEMVALGRLSRESLISDLHCFWVEHFLAKLI
jgi:hypothetical protein